MLECSHAGRGSWGFCFLREKSGRQGEDKRVLSFYLSEAGGGLTDQERDTEEGRGAGTEETQAGGRMASLFRLSAIHKSFKSA